MPETTDTDTVPLVGIVSFLRSCIRSNEPISDADNAMIDAAIEKARRQHQASRERNVLLYEKGVRDGSDLSEIMWTALKNLVIDAATASADIGHCIACGTKQANEHDPQCSQQVAAFQAEVYRQRRRT